MWGSSWYGRSILDSFGINSECYNIIILTFWTPEHEDVDMVKLWANIHQYLGTNEFGSTNAEVLSSTYLIRCMQMESNFSLALLGQRVTLELILLELQKSWLTLLTKIHTLMVWILTMKTMKQCIMEMVLTT